MSFLPDHRELAMPHDLGESQTVNKQSARLPGTHQLRQCFPELTFQAYH